MTNTQLSDLDDDDDGTTLTVKLEPPRGFDKLEPPRGFEFDKLLSSERLIEFSGVILISIAEPELLTTVSDFVFEYTFTGKIRSLGGVPGADMVEYGISRFKRLKEAETDEPLAILGLVTFLQRNGHTLLQYLSRDFNTWNPAYQGVVFEHYVTYLLAREFSDPAPLSAVFDFVGGKKGNEALQDERAEIVALKKTGDKFQIIPLKFKTQNRSSHVLGCSPSTNAETLEWFQDPKGTTFCFPAKAVGPDLVFVMRLTGDNTMLRVAVQFKHRKNMTPQDWREAISTTDPSTFLSEKKKDEIYPTCSNPSMRGELEKAIKNLGNGTNQAGPCGLLRVICSHPSPPDSGELEKAAAEGGHPLATVPVSLLKADESDLGQAIKSLYREAGYALRNRDRKRKRLDEIEGGGFKRQRRGADTGIGGSM